MCDALRHRPPEVRHPRAVGRASAVLCAAALLASCVEAPPSPPGHDFALFGDNPYAPQAVARVEALIDDVNARAGLGWVIHVGDTKAGDQPCSDDFLRSRFELYQGFAVPFVFTPGDNDWFDCDRESAGGWEPYERLAFLRDLYFPVPGRTTGGASMEVRTQSAGADYREFVENVLWERDGVVYATVHLVGPGQLSADSTADARRLEAAVAWIGTAFEVARQRGAVGVFIATQVDPWIVWGLPALVRLQCPSCLAPRPGLESLYPTLVTESSAFSGQVVLAVGDTHVFRVDKPLYRPDGSLVENFTRVEVFGNPLVHWVRVTVDPTSRSVFTFHQEIVAEVGG